jgi:hypothetical protein
LEPCEAILSASCRSFSLNWNWRQSAGRQRRPAFGIHDRNDGFAIVMIIQTDQNMIVVFSIAAAGGLFDEQYF